MAVLQLTVKTLRLKVNTGMENVRFDERISVDVNQVEKLLSVKNTSMAHLVNVILTVQTQNVINKFLFQKNEEKYLAHAHMTAQNMNVIVMLQNMILVMKNGTVV